VKDLPPTLSSTITEGEHSDTAAAMFACFKRKHSMMYSNRWSQQSMLYNAAQNMRQYALNDALRERSCCAVS
jgi:hypothetical protein